MSSLKKMRFVAYKDEGFSSKVADGEYVVMLNPEQLKWDQSIQYNDEQAPDSGAPSQKYKATPAGKMSFDLVIDCTGVVDSSRTDLPSEISKLRNVVFDYNGDIHRPNFVIIYWGQGLTFKGVLTSLGTTYTYFKPDGTPIRAKVALSFTAYTDPQTVAEEEGKESPDMTHLIDITDGDSLPQISQQIYGDPDLYVQIAEFNGLNKFRQLTPGTRLTVPPLVNQAQVNQAQAKQAQSNALQTHPLQRKHIQGRAS